VNPSHPTAPGPVAVDLWHVPLPDGAPAPPQAARVLSPAELERARRFHREVHRVRYLTVHTALRELLGSRLGIPAAEVAFELEPHGKPRLAGGADLFFNLSDTRDLALVALSEGGPVGVDVERHRQDTSLFELAERFFSPAEVRALRALAEPLQLAAFHRIWTRKEAFVKALGAGLGRDLDSFDVSLEVGPGARLLATRPDPSEADRWRLIDLDVGPDHSAALVVCAFPGVEDPPRVRAWSWPPEGTPRAGHEAPSEPPAGRDVEP